MKEGTNLFGRRDFLKITGIATGTALAGPWGTEAFSLEPFPAKKVTWIVGLAAGGGTDIMVRGITP